jgi:hypothetical protein
MVSFTDRKKILFVKRAENYTGVFRRWEVGGQKCEIREQRLEI